MDRAEWMGVLARAPSERLAALWREAGLEVSFDWLRAPETGAVMVRGRMGAEGDAFNLGEMTVTRAALRLASGSVGHAYVAGRDREKARIAALCDALLQEPANRSRVMEGIVTRAMDAETADRESRAGKAAATKVDFFTMVRGEDQ